MSIRIILPTLALALFASGSAFTVEGETPKPQPLPRGEAPAVKPDTPATKPDAPATTAKGEPTTAFNSVCPMDGRKVDPKVGTVPITAGTGAEAKQHDMGFCSATCKAACTKDAAPAPAPANTGKPAPGAKTNIR